MRCSSFILAIFLLCGTDLTAHADEAYLRVSSMMRAAPTPRARPLVRLPAGSEVFVRDCEQRWCQVFWRDVSGFIAVGALSFPRRVYVAPPPPPLFFDERPYHRHHFYDHHHHW
jgi:hypothetical protein